MGTTTAWHDDASLRTTHVLSALRMTTSLQRTLQNVGADVSASVLIVVGWAGANLSEHTEDAIDLLLRNVIVPVVRDNSAVVVSGGTDAGVMRALGRALADGSPGTVLVGVAPGAMLVDKPPVNDDDDRAQSEPNHRMIRTEGAKWGDESATLVRVAEYIASGRKVVMLAIGGGQGAMREIELAARRGWPVLLATGHDGISDSVAKVLAKKRLERRRRNHHRVARLKFRLNGQRSSINPSTTVWQAMAEGLFTAVPLDERAQVERALRWTLSNDELLKSAWSNFSSADQRASEQKRPTRRLALLAVLLATLTALALIAISTLMLLRANGTLSTPQSVIDLLKVLATCMPLAAAILIGVMERRRRIGDWIGYRAVAEAIIRETYRYRARSGPYARPEAAKHFSDILSEIDSKSGGRAIGWSRRTGHQQQHWPASALSTRVPDPDLLLGDMNAAVYDRARVEDQLRHLSKSAGTSELKATKLAWWLFGFAGLATALIALSWRWGMAAAAAACAASVVAALVSWREYQQRDERAEVMHRTCAELRAARTRWASRSVLEPDSRLGATAEYVEEVEGALRVENTDWERSLAQAERAMTDRYRGK